MADAKLVFDIYARDHTSKGFKAASARAKILGAAIGALAVKLGRDSVRASVDAETQQNKLAAAFKKFPALADSNIGALQALNTELAKKTRFDDDATASGQAVLAQFKLTGKQIEELTPLVQDYAAKTGQDLPTAAGNLGRALMGNSRALKAIGVDYKATGNTAEDFTALQAALNEKVGGFATREGKTAAGQAAILSNQFNEVEESVGNKLVPALLVLSDGLLKVIGFTQKYGAVITPVVGTLAALAGAVWGINKATAAARATSQAFSSVLGAFGRNSKTAETGLTKTAGVLSSGGVWGLAIAAGATALGYFAVKHAQAKARVDALATSLDTATGAITAETRATVANTLEKSGALSAGQKLGISLSDLTAAALGNEKAQNRVNAVLRQATADLPTTIDRYGHLTKAQTDTVAAANKVTSAIGGTSKEMQAAREKADRLRQAIAGIKSKTVTIAVNYSIPAGSPLAGKPLPNPGDRRANGGPVSGGRSYLVGEQGPEVITPTKSGYVHPNGSIGGGDTNNFYITEATDARQTAREVILAGRRNRLVMAGAW